MYIPYFLGDVKGKFMAKYDMQLHQKYFELIKSGQKNIELRLFDEKRQKIKVGDIIAFASIQNKDEVVCCRVKKLFKAESFAILCDKIDCCKAGFNANSDLIDTMQRFYSLEKQKQYGVVGIELSLCEENYDN